MTSLLLSVDVGTSACKAVLFDTRGAAVAVAERPIRTLRPRPGWVEQAPEQWWDAVCGATRDLACRYELGRDLVGIAVTGQMHVLVPIDGAGGVTGPAITLMDHRAHEEIERFEALCPAADLYRITGARLGTHAPLAKLLWLRRNDPSFFQRTACLLPCKDYLRFRLTGERASEPVDAAGTLLYDIRSSAWSRDLADLAGLPPRLLPPLLSPTELAGRVHGGAASETGLPRGCPVAVGAGDDVAFLAMGAVGPGRAYEDMSSTASLLACVDRPILAEDMSLDLYPHVLPGWWLVGGATSTAGAAVEWANRLLIGDQAGLAPDLAAGAGGGHEGDLVFLPYLEGARSPLWDDAARGVFFGLTAHHDRASIVTAVKEGVAFAMRQLMDALEAMGVGIDTIFSAGGGTRDEEWNRIRATVYRRPMSRAEVVHGSALGSAMLTATAMGIHGTLAAAVERMMTAAEEVSPLDGHEERYDRLYAIYRELYAALRNLFPALRR